MRVKSQFTGRRDYAKGFQKIDDKYDPPYSMLVICHKIKVQPISSIALSYFHMKAKSPKTDMLPITCPSKTNSNHTFKIQN